MSINFTGVGVISRSRFYTRRVETERYINIMSIAMNITIITLMYAVATHTLRGVSFSISTINSTSNTVSHASEHLST